MMLCQPQVFSEVIQLHTHIHLFSFKFFSRLGYSGIFSTVPGAVQ